MGCGVSQQSANDAELPTNRYIRLQLIANGSHGKVYRAFDNINKFDCAQKVIDKLPQSFNIQSIHPDISQYFSKLKNIKNDKVVSYHNICLKDGEITIIMDLTKEGTLYKYIKSKGKLTQLQTSKIAQQILRGLYYLHSLQLLHNNLKPSNILLFPNEQIKISDYCIAELFDSRLQQKRSVKQKSAVELKWDNIPYMAPEVVKDIGASTLSDVWGVGCLVIEMITGKKAWSSFGSEEQTFKKVSSVVVPPLPAGVSSSCKNFMESCLAIVPSQRCSVAQLLNHPFIIGPKQKLETNTPVRAIKQVDNIKNNRSLSNQKTRKQLRENEKALKIISSNQSSPFFDKKSVNNLQNITQVAELDKSDNNILATSLLKQKTSAIKLQQTNQKMVESPAEHIVMLNNKQVKLQKKHYRNLVNPKRSSTEETEWTSPSRLKTHTVKEHRKNFSNRYEFGHEGHYNQIDQLDELIMNFSGAENSVQHAAGLMPNAKSRLRMETEPNHQQYTQQDKEYFKKPLKLLKKKIQQRRADEQFLKKMKTQARKYSGADQLSKLLLEQQEKQINQQEQHNYGSNREDSIIDTQVARAERDRYQQARKFHLQKKYQQRVKWENQLKSGKEMLKNQPPFKYYIK